MARRVFFSFHFDRDIWRAQQVRNSYLTQTRDAAGFFDGSLPEAAKTQSDAQLKAMIRRGLQGTSCTVVLIGAKTASRPYVRFEIAESKAKGNALIGVRIHRLKDANGRRDQYGANPFVRFDSLGWWAPFRGLTIPMYDYKRDDGYQHLGAWVDNAVRDQR